MLSVQFSSKSEEQTLIKEMIKGEHSILSSSTNRNGKIYIKPLVIGIKTYLISGSISVNFIVLLIIEIKSAGIDYTTYELNIYHPSFVTIHFCCQLNSIETQRPYINVDDKKSSLIFYLLSISFFTAFTDGGNVGGDNIQGILNETGMIFI